MSNSPNTLNVQPQTLISFGSASKEKRRGFLSHPRHLESTQHRDMLVFRILPINGAPLRWEKWTALADTEDIARDVMRYHFPGHISIESTEPRH